MPSVLIGIIGGSGLDNPDIFANRREKTVTTPFGDPSDVLIFGEISGVPCILLARHGRQHQLNPTSVNYRANVWALKAEGCTHILATSACGGLQDHTHPGDIVVFDQFIDRTQMRNQTFYDGLPDHPKGVLHIPMAEPFCEHTRQILVEACKSENIPVHGTGTVLTIEGPRFSSKAESKLWHSWGADVINMSTVPEVVLAREAGLCYAVVGMVTDYDSWKEDGESVTVSGVLETFKDNVYKAKSILKAAIPVIASKDWKAILKQRQDDVANNILTVL